MKKKHIRTAIICVLVAVVALTAVLRLDIKPSNRNDTHDTETGTDTIVDTTADTTTDTTVDTVVDTTVDTSVDTTADSTADDGADTAVGGGEDTTVDTQDNTAETNDTQDTEPPPQRHTCTIEIRCDTVTDLSKLENPAVAPYIPENGVILPRTEVEYTPGESVFDVLLRVTMDKNIHFEFRDDSLYSGKYVEGINYLYEMDGGPLSGWMYKVDGKFPNYGCAAYKVEDGNEIVWVYTCDLGLDVGDNSTW